MLKLDKRTKTIIIIGAVLLLLGFIYRLMPFFQGISDAGLEIALKERQVEKLRNMVQKVGGPEAGIERLNRTLKRAESGLLTGKTQALAAVDIQNILNGIADKSGIDIKTTRVLKAEEIDDSGYMGVPVQFTVSSTTGQLKEILYGIETSSRYLTVKRLKTSVERRGKSGISRTTITVVGYMKRSKGR